MYFGEFYSSKANAFKISLPIEGKWSVSIQPKPWLSIENQGLKLEHPGYVPANINLHVLATGKHCILIWEHINSNKTSTLFYQSPGDHNFFARKFEAIVSQGVVNKLDAYLYGAFPEGTPAVESFWENVFHVEDDVNYPHNAKFSTYQSFLRLALARLYSESKTLGGGVDGVCEVPRQAVVKEVSVLMVSDSFTGLVVTLRDAMSDRLSPAEFEILYTPLSYLQKYSPNDEVANRVYSFEVSRRVLQITTRTVKPLKKGPSK